MDFSKEDVAKGLERAKAIYEGWTLDELDEDQLIECIEEAVEIGDKS